jgi:hypothetical protein
LASDPNGFGVVSAVGVGAGEVEAREFAGVLVEGVVEPALGGLA